jgi:hypothetical protein
MKTGARVTSSPGFLEDCNLLENLDKLYRFSAERIHFYHCFLCECWKLNTLSKRENHSVGIDLQMPSKAPVLQYVLTKRSCLFPLKEIDRITVWGLWNFKSVENWLDLCTGRQCSLKQKQLCLVNNWRPHLQNQENRTKNLDPIRMRLHRKPETWKISSLSFCIRNQFCPPTSWNIQV